MANILADFQTGQDFVGGLVQGQAKRQAGAKLARRDYGGAAEDLYGAGMLREGAAVQKVQDDASESQRLIEDEDRKRQLEDAKERAAFATQVAKSLEQIPMDQRDTAFESVAPTFQAMGLPADAIDQMRRAPKDNNSLRMFGANVESELKLFSTKDGIVSVDPRSGKANFAYEVQPDEIDIALKKGHLDHRRRQVPHAGRPPAPRASGAAPAFSPKGRVLGATLDPNDGW